VAATPTTACQRCWLHTIRVSAPSSSSSLSLPLLMWPKAWPRPRAAQGRPSDALAVRCSPPARWTLARCAPLPHSALLLLPPNPLRGGRSDDGGDCGAGCSSHEGVLADLVVGGVHLVDGGDGAAASGEHTPASLHFASSKMLWCAENVCCNCMFQVF
jgi:hypothetical protein